MILSRWELAIVTPVDENIVNRRLDVSGLKRNKCGPYFCGVAMRAMKSRQSRTRGN